VTIARRFVPQRDLQKTGFTASLRRLVAEVPGLHAVAFCDEEGEVIDYHSYLDPYETKVAGAVLGVLLATVARAAPRLMHGGIRDLVLETDEHVLFARPTAAGYYLACCRAAAFWASCSRSWTMRRRGSWPRPESSSAKRAANHPAKLRLIRHRPGNKLPRGCVCPRPGRWWEAR